ncbi:MAG: CDP-diacylglycerol--glycerol-3-phosphate 3-phosphatidyltransferase [Bdellovibrionales bacterium]|nr:CDP-diacylglycerol--glycerol-3-phosphate 3-phosphatidyltransferase [Oligoflexia bacterium]
MDTKTSMEEHRHQRKEPFDQLTFHTTPNYLTVLRVVFVPTVIIALYQETFLWDFIAAALFGLAGLTDYFDGYLARKYKIETVYGKLMDPLADKFLVICSLIMLQSLNRMSPIVVMLLVCRELTITGLRALASAEGVIVSASAGGKWKTATQMVAIPCLMLRDFWGIPIYQIGLWLTYISLALSFWSAKDYIVAFFQGLKITTQARKERKRVKWLSRQRKKEEKKKRLAATTLPPES